MGKIIITGATGFAGSHILESFSRYADVVASCRDVEKLPVKFRDNALVGDLNDPVYIDRLTQSADVICHAASWAELNGTLKDSKEKFLNPTLALIDKAIENRVKRFVFLSSITSKPIEEQKIHTKLPLEKVWAHYVSIMKIEEYLRQRADKIEVVVLRVGFFVGKNYSLGLLPILLPRLKTHLVPYIQKGETSLPLVDGRDIGDAFVRAATKRLLERYNVIDIVGKEVPKAKEVFAYLHQKYGYALPHFSVSFSVAYLFARFSRSLFRFLPLDPLLVPSIVLLLEETNANNQKAYDLLGYQPQIGWRESIDTQIAQMQIKQTKYMRMNRCD